MSSIVSSLTTKNIGYTNKWLRDEHYGCGGSESLPLFLCYFDFKSFIFLMQYVYVHDVPIYPV